MKPAGLFFRAATLIFIILFYALLFLHPIDLSSADLGRHLENGQVFFQGFSFIRTNLYSYTYPDYPFINHHWASGVIFFLIKSIFGFPGLSLLSAALRILALLLFFRLACKSAHFIFVLFLSVVAMPLILSRTETRPEIFSYFFCAVFYWVLWGFSSGRLRQRWLWLLAILQLCWVNLHSYFFLGPLLIAVFLMDAVFSFYKKHGQQEREKIKALAGVLILACLLNFLNPYGKEAVFYPLGLLKGHFRLIFENQSLLFLARNHFLYFYPLFYFKLALVLLMGSWLLAALRFIKRKDDLFIASSLITVMAVAMALLAVRNLPIFGYLLLPLVSFNLRILFADRKVGRGAYLLVFFGIVLVLGSLFLSKADYWLRLKGSGLGLKKGVASAANFYLRHNIQGPILNNYNIGGYLIYYLYPAHRPFIDNRPEAYPEDFFKNTYLRLEEDEAFWGQAQEEYGFNVIFYSSFPIDNAAKVFLSHRILDPLWALVYADDYAVILLKRNNLNRGIIARYELAKEIAP